MNSSVLVEEPIVPSVGIQEARNVRLRQGLPRDVIGLDVAYALVVPKAISRQLPSADLGRKAFVVEFDLHQTAAGVG